jgi:hypothetical protein
MAPRPQLQPVPPTTLENWRERIELALAALREAPHQGITTSPRDGTGRHAAPKST